MAGGTLTRLLLPGRTGPNKWLPSAPSHHPIPLIPRTLSHLAICFIRSPIRSHSTFIPSPKFLLPPTTSSWYVIPTLHLSSPPTAVLIPRTASPHRTRRVQRNPDLKYSLSPSFKQRCPICPRRPRHPPRLPHSRTNDTTASPRFYTPARSSSATVAPNTRCDEDGIVKKGVWHRGADQEGHGIEDRAGRTVEASCIGRT